MNSSGKIMGQVSEGNRKDICEAVEAAHRAAPGYVGHGRVSVHESVVCSYQQEMT